MPAAQTRGERTGTSSTKWDAASQGGTFDGCEEEEAEEEEDSVLELRVAGKMKRLVLLVSVLATFVAAKSPRLKFVVHGRHARSPFVSAFMCWLEGVMMRVSEGGMDG